MTQDWAALIPPLPPDRPVLIVGPTASGKSALALAIARTQGRAVVNGDALQVYRCWRVLSARPSAAEEAQAPHHLFGHLGRDDPWSVGHWLRAVAGHLATDPRPVIVGGTGLYFTALTTGLADIPPTPAPVRAEADARLRMGGIDALLPDLDPATAARIDRQNPARVQRAWEVQRTTGRGLAAWHAGTAAPLLPLATCTALALTPDPAWLAARIDARFDAMLGQGALDEARAALPYWDARAPWAQAIGAADLIAHLRGATTLEAASTAAKAASRQYAKRQRTWIRARMRDWHKIDLP